MQSFLYINCTHFDYVAVSSEQATYYKLAFAITIWVIWLTYPSVSYDASYTRTYNFMFAGTNPEN